MIIAVLSRRVVISANPRAERGARVEAPLHRTRSRRNEPESKKQQQREGPTREDLVTAREVADLLDVPVSTVRGWSRDGTVPRIKLGRHVLRRSKRPSSELYSIL